MNRASPFLFFFFKTHLRFLAASAVAGSIFIFQKSARAESPVDFNRDIKPILSNQCFKCHGPDAKERKGGTKEHPLRLDTPEGAFADYDGTIPIVPNHPEKSEVIARITTDDADDLMPPPKSGKKLAPREIGLLKKWIAQGAQYEKHWSYVKPQRPQIPEVSEKNSARNPIDAFILKKLAEEKLAPSPEADRYTLARRVALDLTGLPPSVEEVDAFAADMSADAYEKFVDRQLAKPAFGEHWARMWLDLARYADSTGYASDAPRTIWLYRDYVIRAFNENKPFDQFTLEQLAGDLLPDEKSESQGAGENSFMASWLPASKEERLIATAFHRNTMTNTEGGTTREEFRNAAIIDRVNTTMAVWMGTSFMCCQCHDHKYDPLSQREYFRFFAFLNNTEDADRPDEEPTLKIFTPEQKEQRKNLETQIAAIGKKLKTPTPETTANQAAWEKKFPLDLKWESHAVWDEITASGSEVSKRDDAVHVELKQKSGRFTVELPFDGKQISALKIESLPVKGDAQKTANVTVTHVSAKIVPPSNARASGRYVRVELPGKHVHLALAEVQVFSSGENIAPRGEASQISTYSDAVARLAIDGNTEGDYFKAHSVAHTDKADDPWWEVDLKSNEPVDRIVVWNRTDGGTSKLLQNFRVVLLDEKRHIVWKREVKDFPNPSVALETNGAREIEFVNAVADASSPESDAGAVLNKKEKKKSAEGGWSIDGKSHALTLLAATPLDVPTGSKIAITLDETGSDANNAISEFRFSATDDSRAGEVAKTPAEIVAILSRTADERTAQQREKLANFYLQNIEPKLKSDRDKLATFKKQLADIKPATVPVMRELPADKRRKTNIQLRGNYLSLGDEVNEGVPEVFHPLPKDAPMNRLTLARWLVDENNPLTARVIANRFWEQIFGIGIVRTSEEFGSQGEPPSHPELLDWLACEFMHPTVLKDAKPWDVKNFLKLLVTSAAYRQTSRVTPALLERDPDNRLLARGPRFRLSAEAVRDQALAVSGLLSAKRFGPSVRPPRPAMGLSAAFGGGLDWTTSKGEDAHRRAIYTEWRRTSPYPSMATFDAPSREVCTLRRNRTNTPLQALVTLNDPVYIEAAQSLARRMAASGSSAEEKARAGFRACLARPPRENEIARLVKLHDEAREEFSKDEGRAKKMATDPIGEAPENADLIDLAAWTTVANVLLNLDETVMKP